MKSLVTGANGFVGSALVGRLLHHGERPVRCLVRPGSSRARLDRLAEEYPGGVEIVSGTLSSKEDCLQALEGIAILYHLAASPGGAPADTSVDPTGRPAS